MPGVPVVNLLREPLLDLTASPADLGSDPALHDLEVVVDAVRNGP